MPLLDCFLETEARPETLVANINLRQGDDVIVRIRYFNPGGHTRFDFTGWTFEAKAKADYGGATWSEATVTHDDTGGTVTILFPTADTSLLTPGAVGVWDLEGTDPDGFLRTIAAGSATVTPSVT